jgi:hypothetical protein
MTPLPTIGTTLVSTLFSASWLLSLNILPLPDKYNINETMASFSNLLCREQLLFFIFTENIRILYLSGNGKMFKDNSQLALKRVETSVVPIVGKGVICHVLAILLPLFSASWLLSLNILPLPDKYNIRIFSVKMKNKSCSLQSRLEKLAIVSFS